MRRLAAIGPVGLLLPQLALAQPASAPAPGPPPGGITLPPVNVVGSTPLLGSGIERDKVPAATNVLTNKDVVRTGVPNALGALNDMVGGVALDSAQGNPFQPNLVYRGFQASPLEGNPQGLAVYVNGIRFNQPFGDTVNWDLIPDIAIERMDLEGSNPAFGLNALGGSLSVQLKNGFTYQGAEFDLWGGSFGRIAGAFQYGVQSGDTAAYIAGSALTENGWRQFSPSSERQIYGDLGWRGNRGELHLNFLGADNTLTGNGTSPVQLLAVDRSAVFTHPDETRNKYGRIALSGSFDVTDNTSLQAVVYYQNLSQRTRNGDATDLEPCEAPENAGLMCSEDEVATDRNGNPIPDFLSGGPYAQLNKTGIDTNGYGASLQVSDNRDIAGRRNRLVAGVSFDGGVTTFSAVSLLGMMTPDRGFTGPEVPIALEDGSITPVRTRITNAYTGIYLVDTLDVTSRLSATLSGRFNYANINLKDQIGTELNGNHSYSRFNPGVGVTYKLLPNMSAYVGYSEANRAPTPAELACASPASPCSLTNFFVGDPDLKQVVAHTIEAGLRGTLHPLAGATLTWNAGYYHTKTDDDILLVSSGVIGRSFFQNIGKTLRQGVEAGVQFQSGPVMAWIEYAYTNATFRNALTIQSPLNPGANADGNIFVTPGDTMPGIPAHRLKFGAQWQVTKAWTVGLSGIASSGQFLFADEANLTPKTDAYVVLSFNTSYQVTKNVQIFGLVQNVINANYETFGTFSPTSEVFLAQAPGATITRSLSPAPPIAGFGGVRVTF
jgi:outer membrane receptor protein involved in Fe transport